MFHCNKQLPPRPLSLFDLFQRRRSREQTPRPTSHWPWATAGSESSLIGAWSPGPGSLAGAPGSTQSPRRPEASTHRVSSFGMPGHLRRTRKTLTMD